MQPWCLYERHQLTHLDTYTPKHFNQVKIMKKNKHHSTPGHHVETPTPPQVMDPSKPPTKQDIKPDRKSQEQNRERSDKAKPQPLSPREEL